LTDIRIDRVKLGKVSKTAEGFLKGNAPATRTGVFKYINLDGTTRYELRHPKDVLDSVSLESLKSLPITNEHPSYLVNSENAAELTVGMTGETITIDEEERFVSVSLSITHKDAIAAVNSGKQELSCGYRVDLIEEVGEYKGEPYTHRQTNINYNHLAIVERGRAGREARLNLDGAFMQCEEITNEQKEIMTTKKVDNIESEIEALVETVAKKEAGIDISKVIEGAEDIEKAIDTEVGNLESKDTANADSLKSTIEKQKIELDSLKSVNIDSLVTEMAKKRVFLLNKAASVINTDGLIDKSEREIMECVIKSKLVNNADFTSKSNDYIEGRFDSLVEDMQHNPIRRQMTNLDVKAQEKKPTNLLEVMIAKQKAGN
jgi:hypothetical protein